MKQVTLEEVSEFITDGTHGSPKRTEEVSGIPLLSAENVFDGEIRWDEFDRVPPAELQEFQKRVHLKKGDVLMTCVGSIGRAAVWQNERPVVFFRSVAIIRPKPILLSEFLEYVIRSSNFQNELRRRTKRASQGGVYLKDIKAIPIVVPPLGEQKRIVNLLDEAEELRTLRATADQRTAALIPALFNEMFGKPEVNRHKWPTRRLEDVVAPGKIVTYGIVQAGPNIPNGTPYIRTGDLKEGVIKVAGLLRTSPEVAARYRRSEVMAGDIVMSIRATVGTTAVVPEDLSGANLTQGTARISPGPEAVTDYLLWLLRMPETQSWIQGQVKGATFREITLGNLRQLPVLIPPQPLQKEFAERVSEIRALEAGQAASRRRLDDLFQSMLHRAFEAEL